MKPLTLTIKYNTKLSTIIKQFYYLFAIAELHSRGMLYNKHHQV